jgi:hypothetical protein
MSQMAGTGSSIDPVGPFGNPDGSRADLDTLLEGFVDFRGNPAYGALATRASDATARIIVGRMGAGKTVYLRRLHNHQHKQDSVYACHIQQSVPSTEVIVKACQWFPDAYLTEKWMQLWRCAILRSLATYLLADPALVPYLSEEDERLLRRRYLEMIDDVRRPRTVYSELRALVSRCKSAYELTRLMDDQRWDDLEDLLAELLADTPPIFFYIDAVDEEFSSAPMYWLRCQKGLFFETMRMLRDPRLGGRLHIVACIRDIVLSSVYRDEHAPRYHGEPHIRVLSWGRGSIEILLRHKLRWLPPQFQMAPGTSEDPLATWLGTTVIHNERRGIDEQAIDYLLRHTRLIPRDVVSLGNALSQEVLRHRAGGRERMPDDVLRRIVSQSANRFGNSQLAQCANQIAADMMPGNAALHGYSDAYVSSTEYAQSVQRELRDILGLVGTDRFSFKDLMTLRDAGNEMFDGHTDVPAVLWQNGLLGYAERPGVHRFYSLADIDEFDVPDDVEEYALHPVVIDAVRAVTSAGRQPIHPYVRE